MSANKWVEMRKYELVCIFDPQVGEGQFDGLVENYENYLKTHGGEIAYIDRWGIRQLAYCTPSMRNRRQGFYVLYQFEAESGIIQPLEEELRIDENVLRHLVTLVDGEFLRVPELLPENQIVFGPPQQRDRSRGRPDRDRDRSRGRPDRDDAASGRRAGRHEESEEKPDDKDDDAADTVSMAPVEKAATAVDGQSDTEE